MSTKPSILSEDTSNENNNHNTMLKSTFIGSNLGEASTTKRTNDNSDIGSRNNKQFKFDAEKTATVITVTNRKDPIVKPDEFEPEQADFTKNQKAYAFLQSLCPKYKSVYLYEKSFEGQAEKKEEEDNTKKNEKNRAGFLLGRGPLSDICLKEPTVSSRHCIIYMETGAHGNHRGIRIYVEDISLNGTFINDTLIGRRKRVILKHNDKIQFCKREHATDYDPDYGLFRILLPTSYGAEKCESLFQFGEKLGHGNFAEVFKGTEKVTGRDVAIKSIFKCRYERKPKVIHAIIQEISTLMSLESHPFIIKMEKTFLEDEKIYLVLEYAPDGELFKHIEKKKLTEDECRFIFWQLFSATKFLHDRSIVHRDLKPENVLVVDRKKLHVKITDFGLARVKQRGEVFMSQCGTPNYVAPEILDPAHQRAYGDKCDLWSLGVMLFISLGGYPPFNENDTLPLKNQIKLGVYEFASPQWDGISDDAMDLITGLMNIDPIERLDVVQALEHPWFQLNPEDLERRKQALGSDIIRLADKFNEPDEINPTAPFIKSM